MADTTCHMSISLDGFVADRSALSTADGANRAAETESAQNEELTIVVREGDGAIGIKRGHRTNFGFRVVPRLWTDPNWRMILECVCLG